MTKRKTEFKMPRFPKNAVEIAYLLGLGMSGGVIAEQCRVSIHTVSSILILVKRSMEARILPTAKTTISGHRSASTKEICVDLIANATPFFTKLLSPRRVQLRRVKGWKKPENTVVVARPSKWGNPHHVGMCPTCGVVHGTRAAAEAEFRAMVKGDPLIRAKIREELAGKNLACWCPLDQPCHADVLLEVANASLELQEPRK